jgi:hypothetical protein
MGHEVRLFRIETKQRAQELGDEHFFDDGDENILEPLTGQQLEQLRKRLAGYNYEFQNKDVFGEHFYNSEEDTSALLTERGLYFTAEGWDVDKISEIEMTASEFTDTGEFAKYEPQNVGWEDSWKEMKS